MTKGASTEARKNGVIMRDLQQLVEVTKRITAQQPGIANNLAPGEPGSTPLNPNPLLPTKPPPIKHLRRSPRLHDLTINDKGIESQRTERAVLKAIKEHEKKQARAEQESTALEPRVPASTPHVSVPRVLTHEHAELRVPTHEQEVPRVPPQVKADINCTQETATKPTAPINNTSNGNKIEGGTGSGKTTPGSSKGGSQQKWSRTCRQHTIKIAQHTGESNVHNVFHRQ